MLLGGLATHTACALPAALQFTCGLGSYSLAWAEWTYASVAKGVVYLVVSELCLYGFMLHPYMGYLANELYN